MIRNVLDVVVVTSTVVLKLGRIRWHLVVRVLKVSDAPSANIVPVSSAQSITKARHTDAPHLGSKP